jgi:hypothetical protein
VIDCLHAAGAMDRRVTIYDIASTDDTGRMARLGTSGCDGAARLEENVGPNPARNWALRDATRPYLLLLDSDCVSPSWTPGAPSCGDRVERRVGTVTPVVVHGQRPDVIQYAGVDLHFICEAVNPWQDRPLAERGDDRHDIGSAAGVGAAHRRRRGARLGLWDERYFMGKTTAISAIACGSRAIASSKSRARSSSTAASRDRPGCSRFRFGIAGISS